MEMTCVGEEPEYGLTIEYVEDNHVYNLGETVTIVGTLTNNTPENQSITLTTVEGVTLSQSVYNNVGPGGVNTFTATFTVTEYNVLDGGFTVTITADASNYTTVESYTIQTEEPNGYLTVYVEEVSIPENGNEYAEGEEIEYNVTVVNAGNLTITEIVVTCELTGDEWTVESLVQGEDQSFPLSYTVTSDDADAGEVLCVATARGISPDVNNPEVPVEPRRMCCALFSIKSCIDCKYCRD